MILVSGSRPCNPDALEAWEDAQSDEAVRGQVVAALHTLLPFPEPDKGKHPGQHRFWRSLKAALKWLDTIPARWADLVGSIRWQLEAPDRPDVRATVQEALRRRGAPEGFFDRLCRRLGAQGWWAGFLQPTAREADLVELLEGEIPRFAVLDYAESHLESMRFLVSCLANRRSGPKIRVVLLARQPGDWWEALQRQGDADHDFLSYEEAIAALGKEPDRKLLNEIEAVLNP